MLTELYIEALLVDEGLAELVWEAWFARRPVVDDPFWPKAAPNFTQILVI